MAQRIWRYCRGHPGAAIILIVLISLALRLWAVWQHQGLWGVDGGAYLGSAQYVLGQEHIHQDFLRPPLAPGFLLVPFLALFGNDWGLKLFSVIVSFALLPGVVLLARQFLSPWQTVAAVGLVSIDPMLGEMFSAGPLPMIGFGLLLVAMWAIAKLAQEPPPFKGLPLNSAATRPLPEPWWIRLLDRPLRLWLILALSIAFIPYVNQTAVGIAALVIPAWTLGACRFFHPKPLRALQLFGPPLAAGVLLSLPALPWYTEVVPGSGLLKYPGPYFALSGQADGYLQAIVGFTLGLAAWRWAKGLARPLGFLLALTSTIGPLMSYDETTMNVLYRMRYLNMAFMYLCAVALTAGLLKLPKLRPYALAYATFLALALGVGYITELVNEPKIERIVGPDTQAAITWLNDRPLSAGVVTNSYSLSLYVGALTGHYSPWSQIYDPPRAYRVQHALVVCLFNWVGACDVEAAQRKLAVDYILVERQWPVEGKDADHLNGVGDSYRLIRQAAPKRWIGMGYIWQAPTESAADWELTGQAPWLERAWEQGSIVVWRILPNGSLLRPTPTPS